MYEQTASPAQSMQEIQELIKRVRSDPRANNKPVLGVNVIEAQRAKNGGYPMHMYHQDLDPVIVLSIDEEEALSRHGYVRNYIRRDYPKMLFRRNEDDKFTKSGFIEERIVANKAQEQAVLKLRVPPGCSAWVDSMQSMEPLPDAPDEDPALTIARLEGQLAEARANADTKKGKG